MRKAQTQKHLYFIRKNTKFTSYDAFIHSLAQTLVTSWPKQPLKPTLGFWGP